MQLEQLGRDRVEPLLEVLHRLWLGRGCRRGCGGGGCSCGCCCGGEGGRCRRGCGGFELIVDDNES